MAARRQTRMLLALDKHAALHVFTSLEDAERQLEAIDVLQDEFEFCDDQGQRYSPTYTRPPTQRRIGPLGIVDIGAFKLVAVGHTDVELPHQFVERAAHLEHSSLPEVAGLPALRDELRNRS